MGSPGQGIRYIGGENEKMGGARIWGALGGILGGMNFILSVIRSYCRDYTGTGRLNLHFRKIATGGK